MPQIFINFRGFDSIFDCMYYSQELAPIALDEGDKVVRFLFLADRFDTESKYLNTRTDDISLSNHQQQKRFVFAKPDVNYEQAIHENTLSKNGMVQIETRFSENLVPTNLEILTFCVVPSFKCVVLMDAHLASLTACEIHRSRKFRRRFLKYLKWMFGFKPCVYNDIDVSHLLYDDLLFIKYMVDVVSIWPRQRMDYKWDVRICDLAVKKMLLAEAMAWLSTLGGGYSALGDYDNSHAVTAGEVSVKQMRIAIELGDPIMAAKCRLFWAQSRMQLGHLSECKIIVRRQFYYAKYCNFCDDRFMNMCMGIWSRLQYMYRLRRQSKTKIVTISLFSES